MEVGDGRRIPCAGMCPKLKVLIQGMEVQDDFVFELGGVDMVLGMEWLSGLGEIRANFKDLIIKIHMCSRYHPHSKRGGRVTESPGFSKIHREGHTR